VWGGGGGGWVTELILLARNQIRKHPLRRALIGMVQEGGGGEIGEVCASLLVSRIYGARPGENRDGFINMRETIEHEQGSATYFCPPVLVVVAGGDDMDLTHRSPAQIRRGSARWSRIKTWKVPASRR